MPLEVSCPGCGSKLKAPEAMIGKKAKCKKCNTSFRIPGQTASDSVGESQALSVITMPAIPGEAPPPMAIPVDDEVPSPPAAARPTGPAKPPSATSPAKPPSAVPKPPPPPTPAPIAELQALDDDEPAAASSAADPFAFTAAPEAPKSRSKAKGKAIEGDIPAKKRPAPEAVTDPFATPFASEEETTVADDSPVSTDPFSFQAKPSSSAPKEKKNAPDKSASKGKMKPVAPRKQAPASDDAFSFGPAAGPSSDDATAEEEEAEEREGGRRYGRDKEKSSNKMLLMAGGVGALAVGAAVAAVIVFFHKPSEPPKAPEKAEETASVAPSAPEPAKEDASKKDNTPKKDNPGKKDNAPKKEPGDSPDVGANKLTGGPPVATLAIPAKLRTFSFRPLKDKPELAQNPSGASIQLDMPIDKIRKFYPSINRAQNDVVVVCQSNPGFMGRGEMMAADVYSGGIGNRISRVEFESDGKEIKCDASRDNKLFVAAINDKLTVWNLADKSKLLEGFDPYAELPDHKKAGLAAVYFPANPANLITVSTAGALHLFEISSKKLLAKYVPENGAAGRVAAGRNVAIDESRASIAVAVGGAIHQLQGSDLVLSWKLDIRGDASRSFGLAVAGLPGRLVYAFEADSEKRKDKERALLFCLPNGQPTIFRWPDGAGEPNSVNWSGIDFIVVGTTAGAVWCEYDDEAKVFSPLAWAKTPMGKGLHQTTEHSLWSLVPNAADANKCVIVEIATPVEGLTEMRETASARNKPLDTVRLDEKGLWR